MPNISTVVERLNDAVQRDWRSMQTLVERRVTVNGRMVEHPTMIVLPTQNESGTTFLLGLLGVINGIVRENDQADPIEAVFSDHTGELTGFKLRGDNTPVVDHRVVTMTAMSHGERYQVRDRAGNRWEGLYAGPGKPGGEQGVHLRLVDGSTALIYFHDVANVIRV